MTEWTYDDGGRSEHFRGETRDCVCRAIAIAMERPYIEVYNELNEWAKKERRRDGRQSSARTGVYKGTIRKYMAAQGWVWTPTMSIGSGTTVHLRADELPPGRLVVSVSKHVVAVIDGMVHDIFNPARGGTRCVYGYYSKD